MIFGHFWGFRLDTFQCLLDALHVKAQKSGIFDKTKHKGGPITEDKKRT